MQKFYSDAYESFHWPSVNNRWFKPSDLKKVLKQIDCSVFKKHHIGHSFLGKPTTGYQFGKGPKRILVWSQMHGNEPTATHALLELLRLLSTKQISFDSETWSKELSICIIPMLNPDGADKFTRQNAQGIDMNRDAVRMETPEMKGFFEFVRNWKPHWAFNLHDQRNIFNCEGTKQPATLSFLAPSANKQRQATDIQRRSIGLIDAVLTKLHPLAMHNIARFTDEYYERALGEYFVRNEVPCVLIECGAALNDPLRLTARKLTFLSLVYSFDILVGNTSLQGEDNYLDLPLNAQQNVDILFTNASVSTSKGSFTADIALLLKEEAKVKSKGLVLRYMMHEIGDLSAKNGLKTYNGAQIDLSGKAPYLDAYATLTAHVNGHKLIFEKGELLE